MKNSKTIQKFLWIFIVAAIAFTACDPDDPTPPPVLVEDGTYLVGDAFEYTTLNSEGSFDRGINEVGQEERTGMFAKYVALTKAGGFNIVVKAGSKETTYGPGTMENVDLTGVSDAPQVTIQKGDFKETGDKFTVPNDGMYLIVFDNQTTQIAIVPVTKWGMIGGATEGGWGSDQEMPLTTGFSKTAMTFEAKELVLIEGQYKFRHDGGWKVFLSEDGTFNANTNFGGTLDALVPGGDNMAIAADEVGVYTSTLNWTLKDGFKATLTKTGDYTPPAFPDSMFIVGDATPYAWDTPGTVPNAIMHKCAGGAPSEGIFWKICYLEAGKGFKVSDANWGAFNYGFGEIEEFDSEGIAVSDAGGNMGIAESGMYIVVLNLQNKQVKLSVKSAEVYGIGDTFGSWDEDVAGNIFTVDNTAKTITSPALTADGNIRIYAQHSWIPAWWNAEFRVADGAIDYRNDGGDQEAVAGSAGQVITLTFDDNTGKIEYDFLKIIKF